MSSTRSLLTLRSWRAEQLIGYLRAVEADLSRNALLERLGRKFGDLRQPLKVIPFDMAAELKEVERREHMRDLARRDRSDRRTQAEDIYAPRDRRPAVQPEPLQAAIGRLDLVMLLGDPGSGKSTFARQQVIETAQTARQAIEHATALPEEVTLPVFLHLADLAAELGDEAVLCRLLVEIGIAEQMPPQLTSEQRVAAAMIAALRRRLPPVRHAALARLVWRKLLAPRPTGAEATRPALVCLDGLDEAAAQRDVLVKHLSAFGAATGARVIVSSRIAGYGGNPLFRGEGPGRRELRLCAFEQADADRFINAFFAGDKEATATKLIGELRSKSTVAGFASNPLLATLMCAAYERGDPPLTLPVRRVALYERVLRGLLGEWPDERDGTTPEPEAPRRWQKLWPGVSLKTMIDSKLLLIEAIADKFFPGQMFTGESLDQFLGGDVFNPTEPGFLGTLKRAHPFHSLSHRVAHFRQPIIDELCEDGVLVRMGDAGNPSYAFLHLTAQEFLVARAHSRRGWEAIALKIDRKSWDPRWEEVVVMLAGLLDDAGPLLDLLANCQTDDFLSHRTILAALALPEMPDGVRHRHGRRIAKITTAVVDRFLAVDEFKERELMAFCTRPLPGLAAVNGEYQGTSLLNWLNQGAKKCVSDKDSSRLGIIRWFGAAVATPGVLAALGHVITHDLTGAGAVAAETVSSLGPPAATTEILASLGSLLRPESEDRLFRVGTAVRGLGPAAATPRFLTALDRALRHDGWRVRAAAADAVGRLRDAAASPEVLGSLERMLTDVDSPVAARLAAADAIVRLGTAATISGFMPALADLLSCQSKELNIEILELYYDVGAPLATPEFLAALACVLADDSMCVGSAAMHVLGALGAAAATSAFLDALAQMLVCNKRAVRKKGAMAVAQLGPAAAKPQILSALGDVLANDDPEMCALAAAAVGKLGAAAGTRRSFSALSQLLTHQERYVRAEAAKAVGRLGATGLTEEMTAALKGVLASDNPDVRHAVGLAIGWCGGAAAKPEVLSIVKGLLADDHSEVRATAWWAVGRLGAGARTDDIVAALALTLVDQDEGAVLARLLADQDEARLQRLLDGSPASVREEALEAINRLGVEAATPEILAALGSLIADKNDAALAYAIAHEDWAAYCNDGGFRGVRVTAAEVVGKLGAAAGTEEILAALVRLLGDPDEDARDAAVNALGRLGTAALPHLAAGLSQLRAATADEAAFQERMVRLPDLRVFYREGRWIVRTVFKLSA